MATDTSYDAILERMPFGTASDPSIGPSTSPANLSQPPTNKTLFEPYDLFYKQFLSQINSLPINSLWTLWIDHIPMVGIAEAVLNKEAWAEYLTNESGNLAASDVTVSSVLNGILIAQGVKTLGENLDVERVGIKNTGHIQGLINQGRSGFPLLKVEFMENNLSFIDFVIRPWIIAVGHKSLKAPELKTTITVFWYSKMGGGVPSIQRKAIRYEGCCPVSLDEMESNYTGPDMLRLRSVQFAFNKYTLLPASTTLIDMWGGGKSFSEPVGLPNGKGSKKIEKAIKEHNLTYPKDYPQFYGPQPSTRSLELDQGYTPRQVVQNTDPNVVARTNTFEKPNKEQDMRKQNAPVEAGATVTIDGITYAKDGYHPPHGETVRGGYIDRLINNAEAFASDVLAGIVPGIISNLQSTVAGRVEQVVHQTQSRIQLAVNDAVNHSNDSLARAIGAAGEGASNNSLATIPILRKSSGDGTGERAGASSIRKAVLVPQDQKDAPIHPQPLIVTDIGEHAVVNTRRLISAGDVRHNELNHEDVIKLVDPNDVVTDKTPITYKVVSTDQNDARKTNELVPFVNVLTDQNDVRKNKENVIYPNVNTDQNDVRKNKENVSYPYVVTNPNDVRKDKEAVVYQQVETNPNDVRKDKEPVTYKEVTINPNDSVNSSNIKYLIRTTNLRDAR